MYKLIIAQILLLLLIRTAAAEPTVGEAAFIKQVGRNCPVIPLWPGGIGPDESQPDLAEAVAPGKDGSATIRPVLKPSMTIVSPPAGVRNTGVAVLCCPGGGYGSLSTGNVSEMARWLNSMGATAVLLKYRIPKRPDDREDLRLPLQDAQRAMGILRSRSAEFGIDPDKIIVSGSSAGGHLAFNLATHHRQRVYEPVDAFDRTSCRPDAAILLYPAYLTQPIVSLTPNPNLQLDQLAAMNVPPVFITVTRPDKFISGCVKALDALQQAGVPVELHIYPTGGHGGMFNKYPLMEFARPCARFLADHGLFTDPMRTAGNAWLDREVPLTKANLFSTMGPMPPKLDGTLPTLGKTETELTEGEKAIRQAVGKPLPVIRLWPDRKPAGPENVSFRKEFFRITDVTAPSMTVFRPAKADGRCVLVFPGGGYKLLAADYEGIAVCEWLNSQGITALLVKYTVPRMKDAEKHAAALPDGRQAVRLVRSQAKRLGIDPDKIGALGFSAGGHLTALLCSDKDDDCRPNFGMLIYPSCTATETKGDEIDPLLAHPNPKKMPPVFLAIAADDGLRPSAMHWLLELQENNIAAEGHVYEKGGHGKGLMITGYPFSEWIKPCERWLNDLETVAPYGSFRPKAGR